MKSCLSVGMIMGMYSLLYLVLEVVVHFFTEMIVTDVDIMRNFDLKTYEKSPYKFGDHQFKV
jgi:hypothetical protein